VILYHASRDAPTAESILAEGFRNAGGYDAADRWWQGVWLFDLPLLDSGRRRVGAELLIGVNVPPEVAARYEGTHQSITHREWLIPAEILNQYPRARAAHPS
jgi:hypothetical protein